MLPLLDELRIHLLLLVRLESAGLRLLLPEGLRIRLMVGRRGNLPAVAAAAATACSCCARGLAATCMAALEGRYSSSPTARGSREPLLEGVHWPAHLSRLERSNCVSLRVMAIGATG